MKYLLTIFSAALFFVAGGESAFAIFPKFESQVRAGYAKNKAWPWPDICPDRMSARAPFDIMVINGWRRQNLLGPHHFDAQKGRLTRAGELKVHWIMTQAPEQFREIYVERSLDPEVTSKRIAAAHEYAGKVALEGETPSVQDTHLIAEGRPAATIDFINVAFQDSMPTPSLPENTYSGPGSGN